MRKIVHAPNLVLVRQRGTAPVHSRAQIVGMMQSSKGLCPSSADPTPPDTGDQGENQRTEETVSG